MNSWRRRCYVIFACLVIVLILYWAHNRQTINYEQLTRINEDNDKTNDDDDYNDDGDDYVSTGANEAANKNDIDDNDLLKELSHNNKVNNLTETESLVYEGHLPANSKHASPLYNVVQTPQLSSLKSLTVESQQLSHAAISEKRRLAARKQRLRKLRFDQELADIVQQMKKGGVLEVRKKPVPALSSLSDIDSQQWQGLNISFLHSHYPGIIPQKDYVLAEPMLSNDTSHAAGMQGHPLSLDDMTDGQIEERFYQINFDFTFDDAVAAAFGCTVKCFDPSMAMADHLHSAKVHFYRVGLGAENTVTDRGWRLMTLSSIQSKLGHAKAVIDVLKIDIDYAEWSCLRQMLSDSSLQHVKQLIVEIHTSEVLTIGRPTSRQDFVDMYQTLTALEHAGFRRYHYHYNPMGTYTSVRTGKTRTCCYELNYININFLVPR